MWSCDQIQHDPYIQPMLVRDHSQYYHDATPNFYLEPTTKLTRSHTQPILDRVHTILTRNHNQI